MNCKCDTPALLKICKTGSNAGKSFFSCPQYLNSSNKGCGFFKWATNQGDMYQGQQLPSPPQFNSKRKTSDEPNEEPVQHKIMKLHDERTVQLTLESVICMVRELAQDVSRLRKEITDLKNSMISSLVEEQMDKRAHSPYNMKRMRGSYKSPVPPRNSPSDDDDIEEYRR